jgi:hypothetical protein
MAGPIVRSFQRPLRQYAGDVALIVRRCMHIAGRFDHGHDRVGDIGDIFGIDAMPDKDGGGAAGIDRCLADTAQR